MDRKFIDDHHVVARYLADRLTDEDRAAFEAYYLEHPDMVQEMEATARFKAGLAHLRDRGELPHLLESKDKSLQWRHLATAAVLATLMVGAYTLYVRGSRELTSAAPLIAATAEAWHGKNADMPHIAATYSIMRTRGSSVDADIEPLTAGELVALRVLPEFAAKPPRYRIRVARMSADEPPKALAEIGGLVPAPDNFVTVIVDGALLKPGQYELAIKGDLDTDARNQESTFVIRMPKVR